MTTGEVVEVRAVSKLNGSPRPTEPLVEAFDVAPFVANFDVLAQAEGGIKRLREMVLALAVRGVLVAQDPADGDSSGLVASLEAGRAKLCKATSVRRNLSPVADDDVPFAAPQAWRWVRLGHLGGFLGGGTPSKANSTFWHGAIPWVSPKDMKRPYIDDAEDHISEAAVAGSAVKSIPSRSLLFVVRGMILAHSFPVALTTRRVTINQDMKALVLAVPATDEYLLRACWAARVRVLSRVERSSHGTCRLDAEVVEELPIPLPPLPEQRRIVAKVDELMRLLDDLEVKQAKTRDLQGRLRTSALGALTSAEGPEEFGAAWRRVVEHFPTLLGRADALQNLRATILDLAVRGRLCSRRAGRSGKELLAGVSLERQRLTLEGSIREPKGGDGPARAKPYDLPPGWEWARIGETFDVVGGLQKTPARAPRQSHYPYLRVENVQRGRLDLGRMERFEVSDDELRRLRLRRGDLLVVEGNGSETEIGRCARWDGSIEDCIHQNHIIRVRPLGLMSGEFTLLFLNSPIGIAEMKRLAITTSGLYSLSVGKVRGIAVPVPPESERDETLAKVDYLMKLCDELEAKLQRAETTAAKLAEAVVAEMVGRRLA